MNLRAEPRLRSRLGGLKGRPRRLPTVKRPDRRLGIVLAGGVAVLAISIPVVLAASPAPSSSPSASVHPGKSPKPDKGPETPVMLKGTVQKGTDADGHPSYTVTVSGKTWSLSAGPPWFWGDKNPLNAYVGKSVTIAGSTESGSAEVDVETVDGKVIRAPGKPPWAGGPWVVGPTHPGWKPWMADGKPGNGHGRENAPGQQKDKEAPTATP